MATHPVEHDGDQEPTPEGEEPNPTRLPVEPEFAPQVPPAESDGPVPRPPPI